MKKLIIAFLLLLFAVWLGFLIHRDPGYILVTYHTWSVETSLWVGMVIVLIAFVVFYFLLRIFRHTTRLGINLQLWNQERRERRAGELTNQAFEALIEMQWKPAETLFAKSAKNSACAIINYTAAAYAAQQQSAFDRRNRYLSKLPLRVKPAQKTAKLVESYFYIQSDQWKEALTTLRVLQKKHPTDASVLRLLAKVFEGLSDWTALKEILPQMQKSLDTEEYKTLETRTYAALLEKAIHPEWLDQVWETVPKAQRTNASIAALYAKKALELHRGNEAVTVVENALKKSWHISLIQCYGQLHADPIKKQISQAESWLKKHPKDPTLLLCLGRLYRHAKQWEKAQQSLNQSLDLLTSSETYAELAHLFEDTQDPQKALEYYRQAAMFHR